MTGCYLNALKYEFNVKGRTIPKCTADRGNGRIGRTICPHFKGKCPALMYKEGEYPVLEEYKLKESK